MGLVAAPESKMARRKIQDFVGVHLREAQRSASKAEV